MAPCLERVPQRQLEETRIRCVVLEELWSGDLASIIVERVGGSPQGWVVQQIECIGAELKTLLPPNRKRLEERHVDSVVAPSIQRILQAAKQTRALEKKFHAFGTAS